MATTHADHLVNYEALQMASQRWLKQAFVPAGGDGGGMGGPPPGGDPSGGGGAPPPPGGGMGGPPPGGDPSGGGGGGGGFDPASLQPMIQTAVQQAMSMGGGGAGGPPGSGAALKPKIDVNVEIMQMKNLLAKIVDHLGIPVPAQDMTATSDKLMAMSQGQPTTTPPPAGGGGDPSQGGGAIGGMPPMGGMQPAGMPGGEKTGGIRTGHAFDAGNATRIGFDGINLTGTANMAAAIMAKRKAMGL